MLHVASAPTMTLMLSANLWVGQTPALGIVVAYIIALADGARITKPVTAQFDQKGMGVAPSGTERETTCHHHLLIDTNVPPLDEPLPADDNPVHFAPGKTDVALKLPASDHTLQLLPGDHNPIPTRHRSCPKRS